jgi:hypothetical protein
MRVCKKCNIEKPLEKFYKQKSCKEGRGYSCYDCLNKRESFINGKAKYEASQKCKDTHTLKVQEINDDHAKVQLFACGLYMKGIYLKKKLELMENQNNLLITK